MSFELPPEQTGAAAWYGPEMSRRDDWLMPLSPAEIQAEIMAARPESNPRASMPAVTCCHAGEACRVNTHRTANPSSIQSAAEGSDPSFLPSTTIASRRRVGAERWLGEVSSTPSS